MKRIYALIILIILIVIVFVASCGMRDKENDDLEARREKIVTSLGKTSEKRIIVQNIASEDALTYYVFELDKTSFNEYCYRFYDTKEEYDEWVKKYASGIYQLEKDDEALMTKIFAQKGNKTTDESLYDTLIKKYSDTKKYKIIK